MEKSKRESVVEPRGLSLDFPAFKYGDQIIVKHYSGRHQYAPRLHDVCHVGGKLAVLDFGALQGHREVWLYGTARNPGRAGKFKSKSMYAWTVDVGTLERLRKTLKENPRGLEDGK